MINEIMGKADPKFVENRRKAGMGLSDDLATKLGQIGGTIASDIVQTEPVQCGGS